VNTFGTLDLILVFWHELNQLKYRKAEDVTLFNYYVAVNEVMGY